MCSYIFPILLTVSTTGLSQSVMEHPAYLGSYQVEDSCQFMLCGSDYSAEFMGGQAPRVGSCSGDCHLLAINLNSNKFHKDFLWANCAGMCAEKYPSSEHTHYKPRFVCMESCYNSYSSISPHHSLARYCMKASCPSRPGEPTHQVDCFSMCAEHVVGRVAQVDWQHWATALAGECQTDSVSGNGSLPRDHRLTCADRAVWAHLTSSEGVDETDVTASHCYSAICGNQVKCARTCLSHTQAVNHESRSVWLDCSLAEECRNSENTEEQLSCADRCVAKHLEQREKEQQEQEERARRQQERQNLALMAVESSGRCLLSGWETKIVTLVISITLGLRRS